MLWDVSLYSIVLLMLFVMGVGVLVMMWAILKRRIVQQQDRWISVECEWYHSTVTSILEGRFWGDPDQLRKKPDSPEWKAIEKLLLSEMEYSAEEQRKRLIQMFDRLGYVDFYLHELQDEAAWRRSRAALRLGQMRNPKAVSLLIQALGDDDRDVRQRAVQALGIIQDSKAVKPLVEQILRMTFPDKKISRHTLKGSLIAYGEKAIPLLLPWLSNSHDVIRQLVVEILAELPSKMALAPLIKRLDDPNPEVRAKAAYALGRVRYPLAVKPLVTLLSDPFWYVRLHSAKSLGKIGSPRAVFGLCTCLHDSHWQVRMAAAHSLIAIGPLAIGALTTYLLYTRDRYAGQQIAEALQQSGLVNQWIEDLAAPDTETVQKAQNILSAVIRNFLLDSFVTAARSHPNRQVRLRLVEILNGIVNLHVSKVLRQISLYDPDPGVRTLAQDVLARRLRQRLVFNHARSLAERPSMG
jgi:HEAT repeat protein